MHKQSHQNTHPTFTYRKGRIFYFRRKIPCDLRCHYKRPVFVQSLRTTSRSSAQKAATILSARLDEQWLMLRIKHNQSPASQLLVEAEHKSELPLISEILERYLDTKGHGKAELFFVHAKRNIGYVISAIGNKSIDLYSKTDAVEFRNWLIRRGLQSSSIQRIFSSVKAILNFAINEFGYGFSNAFTGVYIAPDEEKEKRRPPGRLTINTTEMKPFMIASYNSAGDEISGEFFTRDGESAGRFVGARKGESYHRMDLYQICRPSGAPFADRSASCVNVGQNQECYEIGYPGKNTFLDRENCLAELPEAEQKF